MPGALTTAFFRYRAQPWPRLATWWRASSATVAKRQRPASAGWAVHRPAGCGVGP